MVFDVPQVAKTKELEHQRKIANVQWDTIAVGIPLVLFHYNVPIGGEFYPFGAQGFILFVRKTATQTAIFEYNAMPRHDAYPTNRAMRGRPIIAAI